MPTPLRPIVVVGSINMDLVAHTARIPLAGETLKGNSFRTHPGGKGANQAVAAARLGHPVAMIGRVGDDAFGEQLRNGLRDEGVDVAAVTTTPGPSGIAVILVAGSGENCIVVTPGANEKLQPSDLEAQRGLIQSAGIVLTQLEIPYATVEYLAQMCANSKVALILDPAPAPSHPLPKDLLQKISWLTPNESEAASLAGEREASANGPELQREGLLAAGARGLLLKRGRKGVYVAPEGGNAFQVDPFPVHALDTTAAGDAFNGAFAVALMQGRSEEESAQFAAAAAAVSVTRPGAQAAMPDLAETKEMLASRSAKTDCANDYNKHS